MNCRTIFQKEENGMQNEYKEVEIKVISFTCEDVLTASGDNYEDDPWGDFEY